MQVATREVLVLATRLKKKKGGGSVEESIGGLGCQEPTEGKCNFHLVLKARKGR